MSCEEEEVSEMKFEDGYRLGDVQIHKKHRGECFDQEPYCYGGGLPFGTAYLPYSWGDWVIGGPEQVRMMIKDLTKLLEEMEK